MGEILGFDSICLVQALESAQELMTSPQSATQASLHKQEKQTDPIHH